jgi:hypothetical protein
MAGHTGRFMLGCAGVHNTYESHYFRILLLYDSCKVVAV